MKNDSPANPDVKISPSGVRYVTSSDVLRSESGRALLRETARHFEKYPIRTHAKSATDGR